MKKKLWLVLFAVLLCLMAVPVFAQTQVIPTDVTTASDGCALLGIRGSYIADSQAALERINEIRKEACQEGVPNPNNPSEKLTMDDYVPMKWSSDLEYIARIRAAETSLTMDDRANGKAWYEITGPDGGGSQAEIASRGQDQSMTAKISHWYGDKSEWVNQTSNCYGYTSIINPEYLYIGLGCFYSTAEKNYAMAAEFSSYSRSDETKGASVSDCIQILEVSDKYLTGTYTISGTNTGRVGDMVTLNMAVKTGLGESGSLALLVMDKIKWTSSAYSVASVTASGNETGILAVKFCGNATITATDTFGNTASMQFSADHIAVEDVAAVAATCTTSGHKAASHCKICGKVLEAQETIAALGHQAGEWTVAAKATVTSAGRKEQKCTRCGTVLKTKSIAKVKTVQTDVKTSSSDCILLGIRGEYVVEIQEALDRINEIRKEACKEGVPNPNNPSKKLTMKDYVPIKWSSELESIARIRAAESSITWAHTRTNGNKARTIVGTNGHKSESEVLAWSVTWGGRYDPDFMVDGINRWYSEKSAWVSQSKTATTGHYKALINPKFRFVGLGTFYESNSKRDCTTTAGEFSSVTGLDQSKGTGVSDCVQVIEVKKSYLSGKYKISGNSTGTVGESVSLNLYAGLTTGDELVDMDKITWKSSDTKVATIDKNGILKAKSCGKTTITAKNKFGKTASMQFTVTQGSALPAEQGETENSNTSQTGNNTSGTQNTNGNSSTTKATVKLNAASLPMKVKQTTTVLKVVSKKTGDSIVSWKSSNTKVVTVTSSGKLTAKKKGTATVTVTMKSGAKASCKITVQTGTVKTTKLTVKPKSVTLKKGKSKTLTATRTPLTSGQKLQFKSSNKKVATVSSSGKITAKKKGTATITVTSGSKKVTVKVTVK